jgi:hypothetical protein
VTSDPTPASYLQAASTNAGSHAQAYQQTRERQTRYALPGLSAVSARHEALGQEDTRRWAKKIRGKLYYFGHWSDPDRAIKKYEQEREAR